MFRVEEGWQSALCRKWCLTELSPQHVGARRDVVSRRREGGSRLCFVNDPDGYRIELIDRSGK